jgi:hypothetical protein
MQSARATSGEQSATSSHAAMDARALLECIDRASET